MSCANEDMLELVCCGCGLVDEGASFISSFGAGFACVELGFGWGVSLATTGGVLCATCSGELSFGAAACCSGLVVTLGEGVDAGSGEALAGSGEALTGSGEGATGSGEGATGSGEGEGACEVIGSGAGLSACGPTAGLEVSCEPALMRPAVLKIISEAAASQEGRAVADASTPLFELAPEASSFDASPVGSAHCDRVENTVVCISLMKLLFAS